MERLCCIFIPAVLSHILATTLYVSSCLIFLDKMCVLLPSHLSLKGMAIDSGQVKLHHDGLQETRVQVPLHFFND